MLYNIFLTPTSRVVEDEIEASSEEQALKIFKLKHPDQTFQFAVADRKEF